MKCSRCGGPHRFDTVVANDDWNRVIRGGGPETADEFLCLACIVEAFAAAGEGLVAELWGEAGTGLDGTPIALVL